MTTVFENATIRHTAGNPNSHKAVMEVLPSEGFMTAIKEITQWEGYAPTPLYNLKELAENFSR